MKLRHILAAVGLMASPAVSAAPVAPEAPAEPVQVMVLGTYHFANPGRDVVNVEADNVLTPARQRELEVLAEALTRFKPSKIIIESEAEGPDFAVDSYRSFAPGMLTTTANESVQIGYRLAHKLGHENVYGFDEQPSGDEPNYFPFGAVQEYAAAHNMTERISKIMGEVETMIERLEADQATKTIPELLMTQNRIDVGAELHGRAYYGLLAIGDGEQQPGAELNAYWFMRNAKMFAKLGLIADPGDRVLVVVGGGHKFWLDHLAGLTPGYASVDPVPYLEQAAAELR